MATPLIAGNWKMNTTAEEATALATALRPGLETVEGVTKVVCPPFISLKPVAEALAGSNIALGAQDVHPEESGAYTGEVSVSMLKSICSFVIVGHSERRQMFGETDAMVARKAAAVAVAGMRPIVCVGEPAEVREAGEAETFVTGQLRAGVAGVSDPAALVIAYEPIWAIGSGKSARPDVAQRMIGALREALREVYGSDAAKGVPVLYGGSVNAENIGPFVDRPDIDGALVGGASLNPDEFVRIVKLTASIRAA